MASPKTLALRDDPDAKTISFWTGGTFRRDPETWREAERGMTRRQKRAHRQANRKGRGASSPAKPPSR